MLLYLIIQQYGVYKMKHITTNILIDTDNMEQFKILCVKRKEKTGEVIGRLLTAEVNNNIKLIKGVIE